MVGYEFMIGIIVCTVKPVILKENLDGDTQNIRLEVLHKYNPYQTSYFLVKMVSEELIPKTPP